jgi:hypothetical protein
MVDFVHVPLSEIAWCAGFFVGEGYCSLKKDKRGVGYEYLMLAVQMNDERAVRRFGEAFRLKVYSYGPYRPGGKVVFRVVASNMTAERILRLLYPHLVDTDKGEQVRAAFEAARLPSPSREPSTEYALGRPPGKPHSEEHKARIGAAVRAAYRKKGTLNV